MKAPRIAILLVLFLSFPAHAQILAPDTDLAGIWAGSAAWGDYDGNGTPDLLVVGLAGPENGNRPIARIYRNTGGVLTSINASLTGIYLGQAAWGDYDGDGDLDIALSGLDANGENVFKLYKNDNGIFSEDVEQTGFIPVRHSALSWGDYDNDGDLDLIVSGMTTAGNPLTALYNNRRIDRTRIGSALGGRPLFEVDAPNTERLINLHLGNLSWADLDGDGDLDLSASGYATGGTRQTRIFLNQPLGTLIQDERNTDLLAVSQGDLAWADYDNDGDLDLALSGWTSEWETALELYTNTSGILRRDLTFSATRVAGSLSWGDYDNDGDLDLAVAGQNALSDRFAFILANTRGAFQEDQRQTLTGLRGGDISFVDVDTDGDLDLLIAGENAAGTRNTTLYKSAGAPLANTPPQPPDRLGAPVVTGDDVFLNWNDGTDAQTGSLGLTYTLRIGTSPGAHNVFSGAVPIGPGNLGTHKTIRLSIPLARDTYYWSVRTTDGGGLSSPEAQEQLFRVQDLVSSRQALRGLQNSALAFGDYDGDGDPDLVLSGLDVDGIVRTLLYRNDNGILAENHAIALQGAQNGDLAWGDFDNDGDLDLALTGGDPAGNRYTHIYRNRLETNDFALSITLSQALPQLTNSSLAFGDFDNDGDLDLALMGTGAGERIARIYRNDNGALAHDARHQLVGADNGKLAFGDYNGDGALDLAVIGQIDDQNNAGFFLYQNQNGILTRDTRTALSGLLASSLAFGDFDNDGDLDLAIAGINLSEGFATRILQNNGAGVFTPIAAPFTGVAAGDVAFGDFDNDGDLDMVVAGQAQTGQILHVYRNNNTQFERVPIDVLTGIDFAAVAWADIDGDADLDLISSGRSRLDASTFPPVTRVNDNLEARFNPNRRPTAPAGLSTTSQADAATLTWHTGTDLNVTPDRALSYALRVGTQPGGHQVLSGARAEGPGIMGRLQHTLKNLASGTYYWSVQTIDHGFAASPWSLENSFIIDNVPPVVDSVRVTPPVLQAGSRATVVIHFRDEPAGMNNSIAPQVSLQLASGQVLTVVQVSYSGDLWIGEVEIETPTPGGTVIVQVQGARDLKNNLMAPYQEVKPARILPGSGGVVESGDGVVRLAIPPRALPTNLTAQPDVNITARAIDNPPSGTTPAGLAYDIAATPSFQLLDPATLSFKLGATQDNLAVYQRSGATWTRLGGTLETGEIRVPIDQFGAFALFRESAPPAGAPGISNIDFSNRAFSPASPAAHNPLLGNTDIAFDLGAQATVRIEIYSRTGRLQRILEPGRALGPGRHVIPWDGRDHENRAVTSGLYIVVITADGHKAHKTLAVVNN